MNTQFKKGVLELLVLAQLAKKDQYGYQLTELISGKVSLATGTLYLVLKRLKEEKYVDTYLVESESGPARKYYTLTPQGKVHYEEVLQEWIEFMEQIKELL